MKKASVTFWNQIRAMTVATVCVGATSSAALAQTANFDSFAEGYFAKTITDNGITFSNLDNRLDPPPTNLVIERAEGTLTGYSGFSPRNCLGFGGWSPGPYGSFGRCGSFDITWDGTEKTSARLFMFEFLGDSGNQVTLEAYSSGTLVASDTITIIGGPQVYSHELFVTDAVFDSLRVVASGAANQGCMFALIDSVEILGEADQLLLSPPNPGIAGEVNELVCEHATPGDLVYFVFGFRSGSTNVPGCPGVSVDIRSPQVAGSARANAAGEALLEKFVPGSASGQEILLQAVEPGRCAKSNLVPATFN